MAECLIMYIYIQAFIVMTLMAEWLTVVITTPSLRYKCKLAFLFFPQTSLRGPPAEIYFSIMKTDERSAQGENTVSVKAVIFWLHVSCLMLQKLTSSNTLGQCLCGQENSHAFQHQ